VVSEFRLTVSIAGHITRNPKPVPEKPEPEPEKPELEKPED
jgi:hypothetical protein